MSARACAVKLVTWPLRPCIVTAYRILAVLLCLTVTVYAQGNSWNKVRYNGGTLQTKVDPKNWDNRLTVTSDLITFALKDGQTLEIPPTKVTGLSYGQEAHRKVATMVTLGILLTPLALFGLFHKTRLHFIGIEYTTPDDKKAALLLQGDKDNYRAMLTALHGVTGAALSVADEDRKYVPTGVGASTVSAASAPALQEGKVVVTSMPDGAEVSVDGAFVGNTPATLTLTPGTHVIRVTLVGYKEWGKELTVLVDSSLRLTAVLEKSASAQEGQQPKPVQEGQQPKPTQVVQEPKPAQDVQQPKPAQDVQHPKPAQAEQFVTLIAIECPAIITQTGVEATIKFKADRSLRDFKMILAFDFPVGQAGVGHQESYYYKGERPAPPGERQPGRYTMSSGEQGILTVVLATPTIEGPPLEFGSPARFVLKGKRTLSVGLQRCLNEECSKRKGISNVLSFDVEFR